MLLLQEIYDLIKGVWEKDEDIMTTMLVGVGSVVVNCELTDVKLKDNRLELMTTDESFYLTEAEEVINRLNDNAVGVITIKIPNGAIDVMFN
ncbi:MAG: hypothetical protein V8S54_13380 [Lachnospiraceae bacterium]